MTTHTERTRAWLDQTVAATTAKRWQRGYRRLYGSDDRLGLMPVGHVVELGRTYAVLRAVGELDVESCLDVGCGPGWMTHLLHRAYALRCAGIDLSREFAASARRDFALATYVANAAALPFANEQFDLVVCAEVLEHVEHPISALAELWRVARRAVVVTTQEACRSAWHRRLHMLAADRSDPHAERNYFLPDDFHRAFGGEVEVRPLLDRPERIRLFPRRSVSELRACLSAVTATRGLGPGSFGVLVIARKRACTRPPREAAETLWQMLIEGDRQRDALAARRAHDPYVDAVPPGTLPLLGDPRPVCPECRGPLESAGAGEIRCGRCAVIFPVEEDVPILLGHDTARSEEPACAPALAPVRRALKQAPIPSRPVRRLLRWTIRFADFIRAPMPVREKVTVAWRRMRE